MIGEGIQSSNQRKHSYVRDNVEVGFFTDPTVCIGCKACEVACKEWNHVPDDGFVWSGNSYDNTGHLGASTWRHVLFVEQDRQKGNQIVGSVAQTILSANLEKQSEPGGRQDCLPHEDPFRWVFLSDVCNHCEEAGCLEACPTGAIVRTEVGSVLVQNDVCNGCGYCVVSCPFGVIDRRPSPLPDAGGAFKCTFFYDPQETSVRGIHAFFLILGEPEAYGLPPKPQIPTIYLKSAWTSAFTTAIALLIATFCAFYFL